VLVTGATGAVGPRIVEAFHAAGYRVRTYSNEAAGPDEFPAGTESVLGDINDAGLLRASLAGVGEVVHLAALLHEDARAPQPEARYSRVNVEGTENVVRECLAAGVGRLVFFSTIAVYPPNTGETMTEGSAPSPETAYARSKLEAERIVLDARRPDGRPLGVVLRLAAVYGARVKGNYARLAQALAKGRFVFIGKGENRRTLVYDRDVAAAALLAARHPDAAGRIFNVTDQDVHRVRDIVATICGALGRPAPRLRVPAGLARLIAGALEGGARRLGRTSPLTRDQVEKFVEDIAASGERAKRELGFVPRYDLQAGWTDAVREMRERRAL